MLAAYTTRRLPSASVRRSCATSDWLAGQRNVPSDWRTKSCEDEAASFPGCGNRGLAIAKGARLLLFGLGHSFRKLGGAQLSRLKLMTQLQTQVPDPLTDDLPCLLSGRRMAAPAIRVELLIFGGLHRQISPSMQIQRHDIGGHERLL